MSLPALPWRRRQAVPPVELRGLPLRQPVPRPIREARDWAIAESNATLDAVEVDLVNLAAAAVFATNLSALVQGNVDEIATRMPYDRDRVDSFAKAFAIGANRMVGRLAR